MFVLGDINMWAGIAGEHLFGPHMLLAWMNGNKYLLFLQQELPALLDNITLYFWQGMWIQLHGVPPHFRRYKKFLK
jgi:hypothetical protein